MEDIIEIAECGMRRVNEYLAAGYRLLAVQGTTREAKSNKSREGHEEWYVRRGITYTVGRTADVALRKGGR